MISYRYDPETKTMWIYKKLTVREFLYFKSKYKHVEVRGEKNKKRW